MTRLEQHIRVGEWRIFEDFQVNKAIGKYRVTKTPFKMLLWEKSSINRCQPVSDDIFLDPASFIDVIDGNLSEKIRIGKSFQYF